MSILRRIFPMKSTCPVCAATRYRRSGSTRTGLVCYRICAGCGLRYKVLPIAEERDDGGAWSIIQAIR